MGFSHLVRRCKTWTARKLRRQPRKGPLATPDCAARDAGVDAPSGPMTAVQACSVLLNLRVRRRGDTSLPQLTVRVPAPPGCAARDTRIPHVVDAISGPNTAALACNVLLNMHVRRRGRQAVAPLTAFVPAAPDCAGRETGLSFLIDTTPRTKTPVLRRCRALLNLRGRWSAAPQLTALLPVSLDSAVRDTGLPFFIDSSPRLKTPVIRRCRALFNLRERWSVVPQLTALLPAPLDSAVRATPVIRRCRAFLDLRERWLVALQQTAYVPDSLDPAVRGTGVPFFVDGIPRQETPVLRRRQGFLDLRARVPASLDSAVRGTGMPYYVDSIPAPIDTDQLYNSDADENSEADQGSDTDQGSESTGSVVRFPGFDGPWCDWDPDTWLDLPLPSGLGLPTPSSLACLDSEPPSLRTSWNTFDTGTHSTSDYYSIDDSSLLTGDTGKVKREPRTEKSALPTWPRGGNMMPSRTSSMDWLTQDTQTIMAELLWILMDAENIDNAAMAAVQVGADWAAIRRFSHMLQTVCGQRNFLSSLWHHLGDLVRLHKLTRSRLAKMEQEARRMEQQLEMPWTQTTSLFALRMRLCDDMYHTNLKLKQQLEDIDTINLWCLSWKERLYHQQDRTTAELLRSTSASYLEWATHSR